MSATGAARRSTAAPFAVLALLLASLVAGVVAATPAAADATITLRPPQGAPPPAPLLPGTRAPEIAGGSSVDDVLSALAPGESRDPAPQAVPETNSRRDFGLPIALALLAIVGVAAMLLRTLLSEPLPGQASTVPQ